MKITTGEEFLNKIYNDLQGSIEVKNSVKFAKKDNPQLKVITSGDKIKLYMERLNKFYNKVSKNQKVELIKNIIYEKYVIKRENVPNEYFELQKRIALERGYGYLEYTEDLKKMEINQIIEEQKESLDEWLNYFSSEETNYYPMWYKYYVFQNVVKIGYYDKEKADFTKRTNSTVKPFIELNREAIAYVYSKLTEVLNNENINDEQLETLINNGSFSKIYSYVIKKLDGITKDNIKSKKGIWKKYLQGSDPNILFNDIHGKNTGWCTAGGLKTATEHLNGGDFYVYSTLDKNGEYTNPRIAIRTKNGKLEEIRGIAHDQNLEPDMEIVVEEKLQEFPDKDIYLKKTNDMKKLTLIYNKNMNDEELTVEELRFLYRIDSIIEGFGYSVDPRINKIINDRNIIKDLSKIFNCNPSQITFTEDEVLNGDSIFHCGDLNFRDITSAEGLRLPKIVCGDLNLSGLTSANGLVLPEEVKGYLDLSGLTSAKGLRLPKKTNHLILRSITSAEGLILPEQINGDLNLSGITSIEGLVLPQNFNGGLSLCSITNLEGFKLPEEINGNLFLDSIISAEGLILPKKVNGDLHLNGITSAKGLILPEEVNGCLCLNGLIDAEGLMLPKTFIGDLYVESLENLDDIMIPDDFNFNLSSCIISKSNYDKYITDFILKEDSIKLLP